MNLEYIYRFRITMKDKSINEEDKVFQTYVFTHDNNPKVIIFVHLLIIISSFSLE